MPRAVAIMSCADSSATHLCKNLHVPSAVPNRTYVSTELIFDWPSIPTPKQVRVCDMIVDDEGLMLMQVLSVAVALTLAVAVALTLAVAVALALASRSPNPSSNPRPIPFH